MRRGPALALVLALAGPAAAHADVVAVLAVGDAPEGPSAELDGLARQLAGACRDRGASVLERAELRERLAGPGGPRLDELERAWRGAERAFADADLETSARVLRALLDGLDRAPDSAGAHALRVRALARLAYTERALRHAAAAAALLDALVALEPGFAPDPLRYPPSFRHDAEEAQRRARSAATAPLTITSRGGAALEVYVSGRPVGRAPVTVALRPGRHRIGATAGALRLPAITVELRGDAKAVELAGDVAAALRLDPGPALALAPGGGDGTVTRAGEWLGASRVVAARLVVTPAGRFLDAAVHDVARGALERAGRVRVDGATASSAALGALAAHLLTGERSREVTSVPALDLAPRADVVAALASPSLAAEARAPEPPRAPRWLRPVAYGAGAAALGLAGLATYEALQARSGYRDAATLLRGDGVFQPGADQALYDARRAAAAHHESIAYASAASAALFAATAGLLGYTSWAGHPPFAAHF